MPNRPDRKCNVDRYDSARASCDKPATYRLKSLTDMPDKTAEWHWTRYRLYLCSDHMRHYGWLRENESYVHCEFEKITDVTQG